MLKPLIEQAQRQEIILLFGDAVCFGCGGQEGKLWSKEPLSIPRPTGSEPLEVIGALNPFSYEVSYIDNVSKGSHAAVVRRQRKQEKERLAARAKRDREKPERVRWLSHTSEVEPGEEEDLELKQQELKQAKKQAKRPDGKTGINGDTFKQYLMEVSQHYRRQDLEKADWDMERAQWRPIKLVVDNVAYQHRADVVEFARQLDIELVYLPTYSPNLNLIERLWRFIRRKRLRTRWYRSFEEFVRAVHEVLDQAHTTFRDELVSWLKLEFQILPHAQFVPP